MRLYDPAVTHSHSASRDILRTIARRAMLERGLLPDFSAEVLAEIRSLPDTPVTHDYDIRDLRSLLWCSIDNDDSRDLDQLSVAERLEDGRVRLLVAVADVDAMVTRGSATDDHARTNTTSVYTAAAVFPMLPEKLSTDLTSLNQDEPRLAMIVDITVDPDGALVAEDVYRGLVMNRAKLAYDAVAAWLDGEAPPPAALAAVAGLDARIRLQDRVAETMRARRLELGALTLDTAEARPVFVGDTLTDLRPDEKNRARELIEDLMIAANGVVARFLDARGLPSLRRVLRTPKRWDRIVQLAATFGDRLPVDPEPKALQEFLVRRRAADPDGFPDVSLSVVKLLGSGEYAVERPGRHSDGHFGLAARDYSHSTAPNRRFPDLATQRLLKAAIVHRAAPYGDDELEGLARHCTQQEDNAAKVERQVRKSAAALLLSRRVGDQFDGTVTGASIKGTYVRLVRPAAEGRVVEDFEGLDVGDRVRVELVRTDVERGFIDFRARR
jgi:VacB/RNase II family 3'-5' exoribonuclease